MFGWFNAEAACASRSKRLNASGSRDFIGKKFESDEAAQPSIFGLINHPHAAAAKFLDDAVVRDGLPDHWRILRANQNQVNESDGVHGVRWGSQRFKTMIDVKSQCDSSIRVSGSRTHTARPRMEIASCSETDGPDTAGFARARACRATSENTPRTHGRCERRVSRYFPSQG